MMHLTEEQGASRNNIQLVGTGLGAHTASYVGKYFPGLRKIAGMRTKMIFLHNSDNYNRFKDIEIIVSRNVLLIHNRSRNVNENCKIIISPPLWHGD